MQNNYFTKIILAIFKFTINKSKYFYKNCVLFFTNLLHNLVIYILTESFAQFDQFIVVIPMI